MTTQRIGKGPREGLSRKEGYGAKELAECFGACEKTAREWIAEGLFGADVIEAGPLKRVTEKGVRRFIARHQDRYDLRRVDAAWFKSVAFGVGADRVTWRTGGGQ